MFTKNHDKMTAEVKAHVDADAVVQGTYWDGNNGKGCFIGCLTHSSDPEPLAEMYGLPVPLVRICEGIFESLPEHEAKQFFADFPDAVGCDGKDLSRVHWDFLAQMLTDLPTVPDEIQAVIDPVIDGMNLLAAGKEWPRAAAAAAAADAAAADAARAAAYAARAARAAAYAARRDQARLILKLIQEA